MRDTHDLSVLVDKSNGNSKMVSEKADDFCLDWQETFDAAMDIIALISEDFEILKINKTGYTSLGIPPEEIIGKKCYEVVHGLTAPIDGCSCHQAKMTGVGAESEITDRGRQYLTTASPIFDADNKQVSEYSDYTTCTLDRCLAEATQPTNYGNPQLNGSGSQLFGGVDVANGNLHFSSTDM